MPKSKGMLHGTRLPSAIAYVTNVASWEARMARLLRGYLMLAVCAALLLSAACEDDPNDLDFLHDDHGDHGDHEDEEDAGR
jgi:hypothetical protein